MVYVVITFILATIGFAANAKYTQMIWIDLRNAPGGPPALINLELNYWINRLALDRYVLLSCCGVCITDALHAQLLSNGVVYGGIACKLAVSPRSGECI